MAQLTRSKYDEKCYETVRRIWHSSIGLVICFLYWLQINRLYVSLGLLPITLVYGYFDWRRLRNSSYNDAFVSTFPLKYILRKEERNKMTSSFYFLLGVHITTFLFSRPVSGLSLLYLAWCDPMAAIIGRRFAPKDPRRGRFWNGKTHVGSLGAGLVGVFISVIFFLLTTSPVEEGQTWHMAKVVLTATLGGFYAAISELVTVGDMDDNLTIPIVSSILLTLFSPISSLYSNSI